MAIQYIVNSPSKVIIPFDSLGEWLDRNCHELRARNLKERLANFIRNVKWHTVNISNRKGGSPGYGMDDVYEFIGVYVGTTTVNIKTGTSVIWRFTAREGGGTHQYRVGNGKWMYISNIYKHYKDELIA